MELFWNLHRTSQVNGWSFSGCVSGAVKNVSYGSDKSCLTLGKEFICSPGEGRGTRAEVSSKVMIQPTAPPTGFLATDDSNQITAVSFSGS